MITRQSACHTPDATHPIALASSGCYAETAMRRWRKFRALSSAERDLLLRTAILVVCVRTALSLIPFLRLKNYLTRRATHQPNRETIPVERIIWAVRTAAAYIPRATCLTQALAAKYQLERFGHRAQLHIGVARQDGRFLAHAWVECEGATVLGGEVAGRYAPLLAIE
jgi:hypothetical protein